MTPAEYGQSLLGWHDFFLASSGATAALLGLLFVGVSINLSTVVAAERVDLRTRAAQAFSNLVFVLVLSLLMLVPNPDPSFIAFGLGAVATIGLVRIGQNLVRLASGARRDRSLLPTLRRIGWTAVADVILAFTAWRIWDSAGRAEVIPNLIGVVFVLLLGAADIAWEMLTEVGRD
jgi:hypothetical protein